MTKYCYDEGVVTCSDCNSRSAKYDDCVEGSGRGKEWEWEQRNAC